MNHAGSASSSRRTVIALRVPTALRALFAEQAEEEGLSLNNLGLNAIIKVLSPRRQEIAKAIMLSSGSIESRVFALVSKHPDLTTQQYSIMIHDLSPSQIANALFRLRRDGKLQSNARNKWRLRK